MANLGIHIYEQATSISTPLVADSGIPFVVGIAPSHAAASPGKAYNPNPLHKLEGSRGKAGVFLGLGYIHLM